MKQRDETDREQERGDKQKYQDKTKIELSNKLVPFVTHIHGKYSPGLSVSQNGNRNEREEYQFSESGTPRSEG